MTLQSSPLSASQYSTDQHGWAELLAERRTSCDKVKIANNRHLPWVVVGAGFTGLACAWRLAQLHPGDEILLLEARLVGQGASGRNSGYAVATSHFGGGFKLDKIAEYRRTNRINQAGLELLRAQVRQLDIDCQWHDGGFYHVAADRKAIGEYHHFIQYLQALDIAHTALVEDQITERLGTDLYQKAVHVKEGALVQPAALVRGLADNLPANVELYENCPVLKITDGSPITLELENASITTDRLVLATNYEIARLGFLGNYLVGSTLSGSFTRVLSEAELASLGSLSQWGALSLHSGGATVRLTRDKRICLRNTAEYQGAKLLSDKQLLDRQAIHREGFDRRFPQLREVPFQYAWSGVEGISRNGTNFFGRQSDNIFYAGGYNGSGVSRGTAFGTALADYASGGGSSLVDDCLAVAPASWLPPRPLLDIGAAFSVRWRFKGVGLDR